MCNVSSASGSSEADLRAVNSAETASKIKLQDQPFQLCTSSEKPGEVVTREELRGKLWRGPLSWTRSRPEFRVKRLRTLWVIPPKILAFIATLSRRGTLSAPSNGIAQKLHSHSLARRHWRIALAAAISFRRDRRRLASRTHSAGAARFTERRLTGNPGERSRYERGHLADGKYLAFADRAGSFSASWPQEKPIRPDRWSVEDLSAGKDPGPFAVSWFPTAVTSWQRAWHHSGRKPSMWSVSVFGGSPRKLMDAAAFVRVPPTAPRLFCSRRLRHQESG